MFGQSFIIRKATQKILEDLGVDKETANNASKVVGVVVAIKTLDVAGGKAILIDEVINR